jgi:hypothetical protein
LIVWRKAHEFALGVYNTPGAYKLTRAFPPAKRTDYPHR